MADPTPTPNPTPADPPASDPPPDPPADDDKPLGPEGEKALQAWKDRAKTAERDAKRAKDLEAKLAEIEASQMSEQEKAIEAARKEAADAARAEVLGSVNERLFRSELRAATAGKLTTEAAKDLLVDAQVATKLLGLDEVPVTETGDIDSEAISQAVTSYVEARPYLAAQTGTPRPGAADQGARPPATQPDLGTLDDPNQVLEAVRKLRQ